MDQNAATARKLCILLLEQTRPDIRAYAQTDATLQTMLRPHGPECGTPRSAYVSGMLRLEALFTDFGVASHMAQVVERVLALYLSAWGAEAFRVTWTLPSVPAPDASLLSQLRHFVLNGTMLCHPSPPSPAPPSSPTFPRAEAVLRRQDAAFA